jgi:hypothetical protein
MSWILHVVLRFSLPKQVINQYNTILMQKIYHIKIGDMLLARYGNRPHDCHSIDSGEQIDSFP